MPWRKADVKYSQNEVYLDIVEEVDAIVGVNGQVRKYKPVTTFAVPVCFVSSKNCAVSCKLKLLRTTKRHSHFLKKSNETMALF